MANRVSRYAQMYQTMYRPNSAAAFPKHVFTRAANLRSNVYDRVGDR